MHGNTTGVQECAPEGAADCYKRRITKPARPPECPLPPWAAPRVGARLMAALEPIRNALEHPPLALRNLVLPSDHHRKPHGAHSACADGAPKTLPAHIPRMCTPPHQPTVLQTNARSPPNGPGGVARRRASWRLGEENGVVRHLHQTAARYRGWNISNGLCKQACKQN